jgi:hypothetical protein
MDIENEEDKIEQFLEPPKKVKITDIQVCILELPIEARILNTFLFAYPYKFEDGGIIHVYNASYKPIGIPLGSEAFSSKSLLWRAYRDIKNKALKDNPDLKVVYEGKILRDEHYGTRKFK